MTLLSVVVTILDALGLGWADVPLTLAPPLHMYRQLRGTYGVSRAGGALRTVALLAFAGLALLIFAGLIVAESTD
jgi:hypothetical protein